MFFSEFVFNKKYLYLCIKIFSNYKKQYVEMKTFLDFFNKKAILDSSEKASNGNFTMYYVSGKKHPMVYESDKCSFYFISCSREKVMIVRDGITWMRRPIHNINCKSFGGFKISELNTNTLKDDFMGITVYLNREDAEKALLKK